MTLPKVHRILCLAIVAGAVLQFFLAGLFNFGTDSFDVHRGVGSLLSLLGLAALVLASIGRKEAVQSSAVLFGLLVLQHVLAIVGEDVSVIGALHPVNGLLIMGTAGMAAAGRPFGFGHGAPAGQERRAV